MSDLFLHKTALVTGASSGLGREFARQLASKGTSLVVCARSEAPLTELAREIEAEFDVSCDVVPADLSKEVDVKNLLETLSRRGTQIDHIINNAGFGTVGPFADSDANAQLGMVRLHCEATVLLSRHFLPAMLERGHGGVLNVASVLGLLPAPYMATYAATKTFVVAFTRALAEELKNDPVRVMVLCPGPISTGFQARAKTVLGPAEKLAALSAEDTVRRALQAYENGATRASPGLIVSLIACAAECTPWALSAKIYELVARWLGRTDALRRPARP